MVAPMGPDRSRMTATGAVTAGGGECEGQHFTFGAQVDQGI